MRLRGAAVFVSVTALLALGQPSAGAAVPLPKNDPFYSYSGSAKSLAAMKPGTVLKSRSFAFQPNGVPTPFPGVQLLYRTTDQRGHAVVTVASVIKPLTQSLAPKLIADQFFYDALDAKCDPSYYLSGGSNSSGTTNSVEQTDVVSLLTAGYTVVTPDYEGEDLAWTDGPQSGKQTLDGIRAALNSSDVGLPSSTRVGVMGYSGGAIATEWASELAPTYAPDVSKRLVGTAIGGIYVYPAHNLRYVGGTTMWSGVIPGALLGVARGFGIDLDTYANAYGKQLLTYASDKCITDLLSKYPGLTFAKLVKPQYADFEKIPAFVKLNNALIMGSGGTPPAPMYMAQGLDGEADGTPGDTPGIGPGDGVMIAGDTRELAREYCARGVAVNYQTYPGEHTSTYAPFFANAVPFLTARFAGTPAVSDCSTLAPGNSLAPLPMPKTASATTHHTSSGSATSTSTTSTAGAGSDALADTGLEQTQRLLLWSALLLSLGAGLLWAGRRRQPGPVLTIGDAPRRRPLPGPSTDARRPLPHRRG